ncbi:hypothetical protein [Gynuella sunshinyii]|uniref:Uncharacterized protein n=1 Tax=Gynuella sunshinyii YC6258 TaxID=1445510 RepID=A0A0C5VJ54_9GAMM|nr:hypothetical protein [Gynuella sunshinyii]AJQ94276.1 hypothetical Protein YC6258_02237 [Gynuella sunshinyii YC6258]
MDWDFKVALYSNHETVAVYWAARLIEIYDSGIVVLDHPHEMSETEYSLFLSRLYALVVNR